MKRIIALEGLDGCGKTTQAKRLASRLDARYLKFPNDNTVTGPIIRAHLREDWTAAYGVKHPANAIVGTALLDPIVFQCLQIVNRIEMLPQLFDPTVGVICDRYWLSAYAYGGADGLDVNWLRKVHDFLPAATTIFIDIPVDLAAERAAARGAPDRYEAKARAHRKDVREWYLEAVHTMPDVYLVDGAGTEEDVEARIWMCLGESR